MKILLVNPPYNIKNYYGKISDLAFVFPPVSLTYLAAYIRQFNHQVAIYDFQVDERDFDEFIKGYGPNLVGITCQTALFYNTLKLASKIKQFFPTVPIIVGGAHPSYRPHDFFVNPDIDVAVRGEGEETLRELADYYQNSTTTRENITGISFKQGDKIINNPSRSLIKDLDILPLPAIDLLPLEKYHVSPDNYLGGQVGLISTARGCPFGCIFCACKEAFNRTVRTRNLDSVFAEIKYYLDNYQISELFIMDDVFGFNKERALQFCQRMIDEGYHQKLSWWCQLRIDCVDEDLLKKMKEAGCGILSFGIESGVQKILDSIAKKVTLKQIKKVVKMAKKAGLEPRGSFILGLPGETFTDSLKTILFSLILPLSRAKFGLATPYPGTKLWDIALAEGQVKDEGENWDRFTQMATYTKYGPAYIPAGRTGRELMLLQKAANVIFYFKPRVVISFIKRVKSFDDFKYFFNASCKFLLGSILPFKLLNIPAMIKDNCQEQFWEDEKRTERRSPNHQVVRAFVSPKIKFITHSIELNKENTLLDVGCGNGFFTCRLAELADVTGLDFSEQMLKINPHHKLIKGNAENLPFDDNSFDIVFCSNLLHHLEQPEKAIAEMKRVAKKYIIISEPNRNNPLMFLSSLIKKEERGALKFTKKHIDEICQKLELKSVKFLISGLIYPNKVPDIKVLLFLLKIFDYNQKWGSYITIIYQKQ